jgi:hypothetical protein
MPLSGVVRTCYETAVANAVAKVNSEPLRVVYLRKRGIAQG